MGAQDVLEIIEEVDLTVQGILEAQIKTAKEKNMKDKSTLYMLYQTVHEAGFKKIVITTTTKEAWDILENAYKSVNRVK
jgi:hypothetical protein